MPTCYQPDNDYEFLVAKLTALLAPENHQFDLENEIKIILGEFGDIWPASIRPQGEGVVLQLVKG